MLQLCLQSVGYCIYTDKKILYSGLKVIPKFWVNTLFLFRFSGHEHIVSVHGVIPDQMCIVMEVAESSLAEVCKHTLFWKNVCSNIVLPIN